MITRETANNMLWTKSRIKDLPIPSSVYPMMIAKCYEQGVEPTTFRSLAKETDNWATRDTARITICKCM